MQVGQVQYSLYKGTLYLGAAPKKTSETKDEGRTRFHGSSSWEHCGQCDYAAGFLG